MAYAPDFIRGTTPDFIITVRGRDLTDKTVYLTIEQGEKEMTKTGDELRVTSDGTDTEIAFSFTQEDTLGLREGHAEVQIRFIDEDGYAESTEIGRIVIRRVLLERVISYGQD